LIGVAIASCQRHRHPNEELDPLNGPARGRLPDSLDDLRIAQGERNRFAATKRRRNCIRMRVQGDHLAAGIEGDHGIGQSCEHRFDQGIADT
jgi:hypothetical protein